MKKVSCKDIKSCLQRKLKKTMAFMTPSKWLLLAGLFIFIMLFVPYDASYEKKSVIKYQTEKIDDVSMELGDSKIAQVGKDGLAMQLIKTRGSVFSRIFLNQAEETIVKSKTTQSVNEITNNGTRRWQYMSCSNGSYRYYTDEQFKDSSVGFTSKSEDYCKSNGQGQKAALLDSSPKNVGASSVVPESSGSANDGNKCSDNWNSYYYTQVLTMGTKPSSAYLINYVGKSGLDEEVANYNIRVDEWNDKVTDYYQTFKSHSVGLGCNFGLYDTMMATDKAYGSSL